MAKPQGLRYLESHEWVRVEGEHAWIGISEHAVKQLSDLVFLDLPDVGTDIMQKEPFGEIESVKAVFDLYAPLTGEVLERNEALMADLDLLKGDAFGAGWMLKIRIEKPSEVANLLDDSGYAKVLASEKH